MLFYNGRFYFITIIISFLLPDYNFTSDNKSFIGFKVIVSSHQTWTNLAFTVYWVFNYASHICTHTVTCIYTCFLYELCFCVVCVCVCACVRSDTDTKIVLMLFDGLRGILINISIQHDHSMREPDFVVISPLTDGVKLDIILVS